MNREKLNLFAKLKYLNLETFKKDGSGVPTPVWFAEHEGLLYVYTLDDAWKVKRVRNNPRVRIAPCDMRGKLTGEWIEARARIGDTKEEQIAHQALDQKYGWLKKVGNLFSTKLRGEKHTVIVIDVV